MEDIIDFRDEGKKEEEIKWSESEKKSWDNKMTKEEIESVNKLQDQGENIKLNDYIESLTFATDAAYNTELYYANEELKVGKVTDFIDINRIEEALKKQILEKPIIGYPKMVPSELGINFDIRDGSSINLDKVNQIASNLGDINLKKFNFMQLNLSNNEIDSKNPLLVEVTVPKGQNYGVFTTEGTNNSTLILNKGLSLKPESINIINIKGSEYMLLKASLIKELDFTNTRDDSWAKDSYKDIITKLNADQIAAINGYVGQDYKELNSYLRTNVVPPGKTESDLLNQSRLISEALSVKPISDDMILYRRVGGQMFGYNGPVTLDKPAGGETKVNVDDFINKWSGKEYLDKAFMSTTLFSENMSPFAKGTFILRLHVPAGTKGAYLTQKDFSVPGGESEFLLDKNTKLKFNKITTVKELMAPNKVKTKFLIDATVSQ